MLAGELGDIGGHPLSDEVVSEPFGRRYAAVDGLGTLPLGAEVKFPRSAQGRNMTEFGCGFHAGKPEQSKRCTSVLLRPPARNRPRKPRSS